MFVVCHHGPMTTKLPNHIQPTPIDPRRRELYLRIVNGETPVHPITQRLFFLDDHFPDEKLDRALIWLVGHNYVGKNFLKWFQMECSGSDLEMHRKLLEIVENAGLKPLIAGKNFRV